MPLYTYSCLTCDKDDERIVPIASRDDQFCKTCCNRLNRCVEAPGAVWAPTAKSGLAV